MMMVMMLFRTMVMMMVLMVMMLFRTMMMMMIIVLMMQIIKPLHWLYHTFVRLSPNTVAPSPGVDLIIDNWYLIID